MKLAVVLFAGALAVFGEVHTLTLRQALELAQKQNPDILIARIDEQRAAEAAKEARDPFTPRLFVGSGLAYTSGFPMSIEGSAPSVVQARAIQTIYNRPLSFQAAAARENARGATIDAAARRDEVLHRVATMYVAAERAGRVADLVGQQIASFGKIADAVRARVEEGRELPIEARAAELRLVQARQRFQALQAETDQAESNLALALGFPAPDRVRAVFSEEPRAVELPESEATAVEEALSNSKQLRRIESAIQAKQLQAQSARSARWPQADLVAQYGLMAKFNQYEEFFRRFQRHNGQLGISFQLPLLAGTAAKSQAAAADLDISRLRLELNATRDRLSVDARRSWQDVAVATSARDVARMDLDVTRERLGVALAQFEEGRATIRQVEELRSAEMEKWLAFYDAQAALERARLELLRATGTIAAMLR
jgi:outer membrane protein TolC